MNSFLTLKWFLKIVGYALLSFETIEESQNAPGKIPFSDEQYSNCVKEKYKKFKQIKL